MKAKQKKILRIKARNILDLSGGYDFTDSKTGESLVELDVISVSQFYETVILFLIQIIMYMLRLKKIVCSMLSDT